LRLEAPLLPKLAAPAAAATATVRPAGQLPAADLDGGPGQMWL
jgi:hypothetical protein